MGIMVKSSCCKDNIKIPQNFRITIPFPFWKLKTFTPTPHASYIREWIIVADTTAVSQNGIWPVYFFFYVKKVFSPLLYILSICSTLICFKVQMTLRVQLVGLRHQMKTIFKPKEHLNNYFVQFLLLLGQNMTFEIKSMSQIFDILTTFVILTT